MRKKFYITHEEDAKELVELWNTTYKEFGEFSIETVTQAIEKTKNPDMDGVIADSYFSKCYKTMHMYTTFIPKFLKNVKDCMNDDDYTLTQETLDLLFDVAQQAKEWKKEFRCLKSIYENLLMIGKMEDACVEAHFVDICDTPRFKAAFSKK